MTAGIAESPKKQFLSTLGLPLIGGKVYTYLAGTTTPVKTYQDQDLMTENTNPIILDARGECLLWLSSALGYEYKLQVNTALNTAIYTVDNVTAGNFAAEILQAALAASGGSDMIGFEQEGSDTLRTVQDKLRDVIHVKDFGAVCDGVTDDSQAWIDAFAAASGKTLIGPETASLVTQTILVYPSTHFVGAGQYVGGIVWDGGDLPVLARPNWSNPAIAGSSFVEIEQLQLIDNATARPNNWTIDLNNATSVNVHKCYIVNQGGVSAPKAHLYGVLLGRHIATTYSGDTFVCSLRASRLNKCKVAMNTTDSYVQSNEIWSVDRDYAVLVGDGGTLVSENELIPGLDAGVLLQVFVGTPIISICRIVDNYFDGSYTGIYTGWGVLARAGTSLVRSVITGNTFWHINEGAINVADMQMCVVNNVYDDCDSNGTGDPDIFCASVWGTVFDGAYYRNAVAPKTGGLRTTGKPMQVTGDITTANAGVNIIRGSLGFESVGYFSASDINNPEKFTFDRAHLYLQPTYATLPASSYDFVGATVHNLDEYVYHSVGSRWIRLDSDAPPASAASFNDFVVYGNVYIGSTTGWTDGPAGFAAGGGSWLLEVFYINSTATGQRLTQLDGTGKYVRLRVVAVWGAWF